jgi:hypothetical protein
LKTVQEVKARLDTVQAHAESLTDFLDANTGDRNTVYDAESGETVNTEADGKRFFTRTQLIARRAELRAEARALPERGRELLQHAQFTQAQAVAKKQVLADFPWLGDPEHPETKQVAATLAQVPQLNQTQTPEYWAAVYTRGLKSMNDELAARKGTGNGHSNGNGKSVFGNAGQRPASKVPVRQVAATPGGGGAPSAAPDRVKLQGALDRNRKEGSLSSLAEVITAGNR